MSNVIQRKTKYTQNHMNAEAKGLDPEYYEAHKTVYDKVGGNALSKFDDDVIINILNMEHKDLDIRTIQLATEYFLSLSQEEFDALVEKFGIDSEIVRKARSDRKKARRKKNKQKR